MILALDPGPTETGYVLFDGAKVQDKGKIPNADVFKLLFGLGERHDAQLVIEMIASYGMPVGKEVFETCVWIGRFIQAWGLPYKVAYRKNVSRHLCHSNKAKDCHVRQALIDRLGAPGTKKSPGATYGVSGDMWAALAVAVYALDEWANLDALGAHAVGSEE